MSARTFTFILEFRGGTYASQYRGRYPREALKRWSESAGGGDTGLTPDVFAELATRDLVPLRGLEKIWCTSALIDDDSALLNVVATEG